MRTVNLMNGSGVVNGNALLALGMRMAVMVSLVVFLCMPVNAADLLVNTNTSLPAGSYDYDAVTVTNNAILTLTGEVTINAASITVDTGAQISGDGKGYAADQGPGVGFFDGDYGSGGGHGGAGGVSNQPESVAGIVNDSGITPVLMGSGGGGVNAGAGGGAITLNVTGTLANNGRITVNGANAGTLSMHGGGAGGSLYVTTGTLDGNGTFEANGGNAGTMIGHSGGGGGGRIAIYYGASTWTGTETVNGGAKYGSGTPGNPGTVVLVDNSAPDALAMYTGVYWRFEAVDESNYDFAAINLVDSTVIFETNV